MIYLDNAASTKPKEEVINAMMPYLYDKWYNPSSLYAESVKIKEDIELSRKIIGNFINADSKEIFFTSSGSEGNCWAIQGFYHQCLIDNREPIVITSKIEHKSIVDCVSNLIPNIAYANVDENGMVDTEDLDKLLSAVKYSNYKVLVSIQFANNEIGTIQNIEEISKIAHKYNAIFHTDAVQAFGHIPIDVRKLNIDMMTASGHKIGVPKGVGFLYKSSDVKILPLIYGSQMDGMRGGTENVPYIIGMTKAVELIRDNFIDNYIKNINIRDYMMEKLHALGCKFNGCLHNRLPNNISAVFPQNITGEALLYTLDLSGILASSGSACNSHSIEPSHVLKSIGLTNDDIAKTIRFSLSEDITYEDIDFVINEIDKAIKIIEL